jgi:hypothetical protein
MSAQVALFGGVAAAVPGVAVCAGVAAGLDAFTFCAPPPAPHPSAGASRPSSSVSVINLIRYPSVNYRRVRALFRHAFQLARHPELSEHLARLAPHPRAAWRRRPRVRDAPSRAAAARISV